MSEKQFQIDQLPKIAENLLKEIGDRKKIVLEGDLGAGKTTLVKVLCKQLGVEEVVTSPTFSIINEYQVSANERVYHLDLYRIKNLDEAINLGIEDYLYDSSYCFIEWPEVIEPLWPKELVKINLQIIDDSLRKITYF